MNFQLKMEEIINNFDEDEKPKLLIHSCCGPCSSCVLECLSKYFLITIYYYNPNIDTEGEFNKRFSEQKRLIKEMDLENPINLIKGEYNTSIFNEIVEGLEELSEGKERCFKCYEFRMREIARYAKDNDFDYFTTTLSVSPYKNSNKINEIGEIIESEYNVKFLYSDFKKKDGYKRSIELSKLYELYRQDYCGCIFSKEFK